MSMIFRLLFYQFRFRAVESVYFPPGKAGNVLRGALGESRPSGLAERPRPFVLRAAHLDGKRFGPGETFSLDLHVFDLRRPLRKNFLDAFAEWERTGLGPRRGRVELLGAGDEEAVSVNLTGGPEVSKCSVAFRTPTELKGNPTTQEIPFGILLARARDRISTLRNLYGKARCRSIFGRSGSGPVWCVPFRAIFSIVKSCAAVRARERSMELGA